ncbi:hypothetical protein TVNIR_2268 [Thioalkalivibrio nitratireducens DSM 14787]|uniref:Uncharacterized protein n=1 Tax=Thioalkalivibrio nitratireducens (strain DSM 14787 / UNIQEM 213 / ALEN2) TaxID=1255043 RepID=L0DY47_THIND|nr:hypothetical protein TVNIR_2268 [Thioalkalivibrio nitratireducens DSM 14787]
MRVQGWDAEEVPRRWMQVLAGTASTPLIPPESRQTIAV